MDYEYLIPIKGKGGDLTKNSDKSPYTNRKNTKLSDIIKSDQKPRLHNYCEPT